MAGARGQRLDTASESLLRLALQLDRDIERHLFYGRRCKRPQLRLPKLWAGFRHGEAAHIEGDGPELAEYCTKTSRSAADNLVAIQRSHFGLKLFPLAWVSGAWQQAVSVFADLQRFPLRQVFPIEKLPEDLVGCQGAASTISIALGFVHTRGHEKRVPRGSRIVRNFNRFQGPAGAGWLPSVRQALYYATHRGEFAE